VVTEHDLYKNIGDIDVCTEFKMLKLKVPIIFLGQVVSRYLGRDVRLGPLFFFVMGRIFAGK
jgi:hypothetical protein